MKTAKIGCPRSIFSALILLSAFLSTTAKSEIPTILYGQDTEEGSCINVSDVPLFQQPTGSKALEMELITNYTKLTESANLLNYPNRTKKRFQRRDEEKKVGDYYIQSRDEFKEERGYYRGVLRISPQGRHEEFHPVMLHVRGHSRAQSWVCYMAPPLKVFFLDRKIKQSIDTALEQKDIYPTDPKYLQLYYDEFLRIGTLPNEKTMAPAEGIFSNLGSELKLVTHCVAQTGENDKAHLEPIETWYRERVLREFALYEMLQPLGWPVEKVRPLNISYFNEGGMPVYHEPNQVEKIKKMVGFFREPLESVGRRCGLDHKSFVKRGREVKAWYLNDETYDLGKALMRRSLDQLSWFHLRLMNALIANKDYAVHHAFESRNVNMFFAGDTTSNDFEKLKLVTAPYDFDLSKFVAHSTEGKRDDLEKSMLDMLDQVLRINENLDDYWISRKIHIDKKKLQTSIQRAVKAMPEMKAIIESSRTDQEFKKHVLKMLDLFHKRMKK